MFQLRAEKSTDEGVHANDDGTTLVVLLWMASNWMTDDEMIYKPKMQLKYTKTKNNVNGEDVTLVCCHRALIAAPIPFHAPDISCTAVSFVHCTMTADNASRCVMSSRTAVYIFPIRPSHYCPLKRSRKRTM